MATEDARQLIDQARAACLEGATLGMLEDEIQDLVARLADALEQEHVRRAAGEHPALTTPPICGNTGLTEAVEARFRAIRTEKGERQDGGCGRNLPWIHAYRCLECGRWMHAQCLRQHFAGPRDQPE